MFFFVCLLLNGKRWVRNIQDLVQPLCDGHFLAVTIHPGPFPHLVVAFLLEPLLVLVPPLLPLDVVLQIQIPQVASALVILVPHADVVPRGQPGRAGGHQFLGEVPGGRRRVREPNRRRRLHLFLDHHLQIPAGAVLGDAHVLHITAVHTPLGHLAEPFRQGQPSGRGEPGQRALAAGRVFRTGRRRSGPAHGLGLSLDLDARSQLLLDDLFLVLLAGGGHRRGCCRFRRGRLGRAHLRRPRIFRYDFVLRDANLYRRGLVHFGSLRSPDTLRLRWRRNRARWPVAGILIDAVNLRQRFLAARIRRRWTHRAADLTEVGRWRRRCTTDACSRQRRRTGQRAGTGMTTVAFVHRATGTGLLGAAAHGRGAVHLRWRRWWPLRASSRWRQRRHSTASAAKWRWRSHWVSPGGFATEFRR
uniref:(northern house mosquito) hypothetical protein n=1 Tax=Culex pipiens TaxID=7175 RepID=A0A8D8DXL5_CULPI